MFQLLLVLIFLLVLLILYNLLLIVPMHQIVVIERLDKYKTTFQPGIHFLIPFLDKIAYRHDTREEILDVPAQICISKDNTQITVDGIVFIKVVDGQLASYSIDNYRMVTVNLVQTTMRSEIGKLTLSETFSQREKLNEAIVREIDKASEPWGVKVLRYEIQRISPSSHVIQTLEKQMEAERSKRAEITLANAKKEATIKLSQGERQEAINISEGQKIKRINEAKGTAQEIAIIAKAQAEGMALVAKALGAPGGSEAMNMQLKKQFIDQLGKILTNAEISIVPSELAKLESYFVGVGEMTKTNRSDRGGIK